MSEDSDPVPEAVEAFADPGSLGRSARYEAGQVQTLSGLDHRLAREVVQGLVRSAIARGVDPAARLQQFRTLQEAAIAMSRDPAVAQTAKQLVRAIDLSLQELPVVKS